MKQLNVLLVGDVCKDVYQYGTVNRISPEAPVPILELTKIETLDGMAANVHKNLAALGAKVIIISGNAKSVKTRFIDEKTGHQLLRLDNDKTSNPIDIKQIPEQNYDCVVISDYNKGTLSYQNIKQIINKFKNKPIFIDTKKPDIGEFDQIFPKTNVYIKINAVENKKIISQHKNLIITDGKNGAKHKGVVYPAPVVNVADACGAGDTFLAALAIYYCSFKDIEIAIRYANIASSVTVQHLGVYAPTKEEIDEAIG